MFWGPHAFKHLELDASITIQYWWWCCWYWGNAVWDDFPAVCVYLTLAVGLCPQTISYLEFYNGARNAVLNDWGGSPSQNVIIICNLHELRTVDTTDRAQPLMLYHILIPRGFSWKDHGWVLSLCGCHESSQEEEIETNTYIWAATTRVHKKDSREDVLVYLK
jgi:hypothetical protein